MTRISLQPVTAPNGFSVSGLIRLARPRQWIKNLLVFAAPGAAGVLQEPRALTRTMLALVAFCLAASGTYYLNDAADVESDRIHETKHARPVATGAVSVTAARIGGLCLLLVAVLVAGLSGRWQLPVTVTAYAAITTSYTTWLKHIAVIDLAAVAAGFVVRAIAGAVATGVELSDWFLIVACFGSVFVVAGKRSAELDTHSDAEGQRGVLSQYSREFMTYVRSVSSGVTLLAYTLFAFEREKLSAAPIPWYEFSIIPFGLAIFRYALRLDQGDGGAPEDIVLSDRTLQVLGLIWCACAAAGVYRL